MDLLFGILGAVMFSFILAILFSILEKKDSNSSNFFQKFTGILYVLIIIVVIGFILEKSGCSSGDDPDYPMKYHPD